MFEISELLLLTGEDIPFPEGQLIVHVPKIREISLLGEDNFFMGCNLLNFSKEKFLSEQDKINLIDRTDFDILMSILNDNSVSEISTSKNMAIMILALLFPDYEIDLQNDNIHFVNSNLQTEGKIDNSNFVNFKQILTKILCIKDLTPEKEFNPAGDLAARIAAKIEAGRKKVAQIKSQNQEKINILSRYISILAVGEQKSINELSNYTIYQLYDEFERYQLKLSYDMYIKQLLAGAKDPEKPQDWMKDLHSNKNKDK